MRGHRLDDVLYRYTFEQVRVFAEAAVRRTARQELYEAAIVQRAAEHADKDGFDRILRELVAPLRKAQERKRIGRREVMRLSAILSDGLSEKRKDGKWRLKLKSRVC